MGTNIITQISSFGIKLEIKNTATILTTILSFFIQYKIIITCFRSLPSVLLGLLVKTLVHAVVSHIGAFHSSLQLLLDHPRVAAVASQ